MNTSHSEREEDNVMVVEAITRDLAPPPPFCIEWDFPIWRVSDALDPTKLRKPSKNGTEDVEAEEKHPNPTPAPGSVRDGRFVR